MLLDRRVLLVISNILLLPSIKPSGAQNPALLSTEGREFWVYPSRVDDLWDRVNLYITTRSTKSITVKITTPVIPLDLGGVNETVQVSASQPHQQEIKTRGTNPARGKLLDGILVVADGDIAVFVNNPSDNATGVTSILSTASLGTDYLFPSIKRGFNGQVSICVGNLDRENSVEVILPRSGSMVAPLLNYKGTDYWPGNKITIRLTSYEFADIRDVTSTGDLTGTMIKSDLPVAVFSAAVFHMSSTTFDNLGLPYFTSHKDIVIENIPPMRAWGKKFVVSASPSTTPGDSIRVLAWERDVTVQFSFGASQKLAKPGTFLETSVNPGMSFTLTADKPVEVIQYRHDFTSDSAPFMFLVPPLESYGKEFIIPAIFNEQFLVGSQNYVILVTHKCHADRVTLRHNHTPRDKKYVSRLSSWQPVGDGTYVTSQVKVGSGFVTIAMEPSADTQEDELAEVGGYFFGRGPQKAYAAPLGLHMPAGKAIFSVPVPAYRPLSASGPIVEGHSRLVARDKLPMVFPLDASAMTSRVTCHHECWTRPGCLFVAYSKSREPGASDCRLYGPIAQCSGLAESPGFLLYRIPK